MDTPDLNIFTVSLILGEAELNDEGPNRVAVKVLKEGASRETREDFKREVDITTSFDHHNILRLLAIVTMGMSTLF